MGLLVFQFRYFIGILITYKYLMLEPYAMKVARTVLRGGNLSNKMTYLDRPYAALLLLIITIIR